MRRSEKPHRPGEISPRRTFWRNRCRPIRELPGKRRQVRCSNPDLRQQSRLKARHLLLNRPRRACGPILARPVPGRQRLPVQLRFPLLPKPVLAQRQPSPRRQAAMPVHRARRRCLRAVRRHLPHRYRRRRQPRAQPLRRPPVQPRRCRGHLQRCNRGWKASGRHLWRHRPVRRRKAPLRGPFGPEKQRPDRHAPLRRYVRMQSGRTR